MIMDRNQEATSNLIHVQIYITSDNSVGSSQFMPQYQSQVLVIIHAVYTLNPLAPRKPLVI